MVCTPMRVYSFALATLSTHAPVRTHHVWDCMFKIIWFICGKSQDHEALYSYLWEFKKQSTNIEVVDHVYWLNIKTSIMNMGPIVFHCIRSSATTGKLSQENNLCVWYNSPYLRKKKWQFNRWTPCLLSTYVKLGGFVGRQPSCQFGTHEHT